MKKKVLLFGLVPVVLIGLLIVNWFVYPFTSAEPNFADVEAVYNKMVVPEGWVKKGEGSNKGIVGRQCPIESDGCFSKAADYTVNGLIGKEDVLRVTELSGCASPVYKDETYKGDVQDSKFSYTCFSGSIRIGVSVDMSRGEIHVVAASR